MKTSTPIAPTTKSFVNTWPFFLWLVAALLASVSVSVLVTAGLVRYALVTPGHRWLSDQQFDIVIAVAEFPILIFNTLQDLNFSDDPTPLLHPKTTEQANWVRRFPEPQDSGYLLFSGVNPMAKKSFVQLIRIADGHVIVNWDPDWVAIHDRTTNKEFAPKGSINNLRAMHPLLLADGDIVFNTGGALVRLSSCSKQPVFVLDKVMHHSIELDVTNRAILGISVAQDGLTENSYLNKKVQDDSLARISIDGHLLENRSFSRILIDNGLQAMLLGHSGYAFNVDPIHLNQISEAKLDSHFWLRGDLLISARHLSTLFLYRPSTNKIIWYQTGPWMNQHSADFIDDHRISIFNNNIVSPLPKELAFVTPGDTNRVMVYDFETKQVTQPFAALLKNARPLSITEGRARLLPDGGLFLEETNNGRHLRFTHDRMLWSRVNDYDDKRIGAVAWSRYLTKEEVAAPLKVLVNRNCIDQK